MASTRSTRGGAPTTARRTPDALAMGPVMRMPSSRPRAKAEVPSTKPSSTNSSSAGAIVPAISWTSLGTALAPGGVPKTGLLAALAHGTTELTGVLDADDTRAMREYLAALDDEELAAVVPRKLSLSDPHSRWTAASGGVAFFAYSTNYLIDVAHGVILDVQATPAHRTAEVESTKTMIERVEERFDLKPQRLIADMAYGSAPLLGWMVEQKAIEPHVPVWDKTERKDGTLERDAFQWNEQADEYRCPRDTPCAANGVHSRTRAHTSPKPKPSFIAQVSAIAPPVR